MTVFDGLDLGWTYTSSLAVDITHDLTVVSKKFPGVKKASSATPLGATSIGRISLSSGETVATDQTYYALSAEPDKTDIEDGDLGSCQPLEDDDHWDYNDNLASRVDKPDNCFRMTVDHGLERNYLDAYTVTLAPQLAPTSLGAGSPGRPGKIYTCESMDFVAMEQVDVCAMFEAEVERLPTPTAVAVVQQSTNDTNGTATDNVIGNTLAGFQLAFKDASDDRHRFTAMWYLDDTTTPKMDVLDVYANHNVTDADSPAVDEAGIWHGVGKFDRGHHEHGRRSRWWHLGADARQGLRPDIRRSWQG